MPSSTSSAPKLAGSQRDRSSDDGRSGEQPGRRVVLGQQIFTRRDADRGKRGHGARSCDGAEQSARQQGQHLVPSLGGHCVSCRNPREGALP